jgi:hypothetical protein
LIYGEVKVECLLALASSRETVAVRSEWARAVDLAVCISAFRNLRVWRSLHSRIASREFLKKYGPSDHGRIRTVDLW